MLDALTGLRFVAAFCVFVHHARERFRIDSWNLGPLGGVAVGFFFVLSGFILTHVYGATLRRESIGAFYRARFARIWPIHVVCVAIFLVVFRSGNPPRSSEELGLIARHVLLVQSWTTHLPSALNYNGVSWSISVEMFFYACFPLLCLLGRRAFFASYSAIVLATALALLLGELALARDGALRPALMTVVHVFPPMRLLEFATGIAAARLVPVPGEQQAAPARPWRDTLLEIAAVASIALAFLLFGPAQWAERVLPHARFPVLAAYLPKGPGFALPFAFAIVVLARSRGLLARALAHRSLVFLGEVSFSFYMIHAIVLMAVAARSIEDWRVAFAVALLVSIAASVLLYLTVEVPMREALVRLLTGTPAVAWRRLARVPRELVARSPLWASIAILGLAPLGLSRIEAHERAERLAELVRGVSAELRDVRFEGEAQVLAAQAHIDEAEVEVTVVYCPEPTAKRRLFIHVAGAGGEVLRQLAPKEIRYRDDQGRDCVLATARAPVAQVADAHSLGVGFWSREDGAARADRGPRSMGGHRLDLLKLR